MRAFTIPVMAALLFPGWFAPPAKPDLFAARAHAAATLALCAMRAPPTPPQPGPPEPEKAPERKAEKVIVLDYKTAYELWRKDTTKPFLCVLSRKQCLGCDQQLERVAALDASKLPAGTIVCECKWDDFPKQNTEMRIAGVNTVPQTVVYLPKGKKASSGVLDEAAILALFE